MQQVTETGADRGLPGDEPAVVLGLHDAERDDAADPSVPEIASAMEAGRACWLESLTMNDAPTPVSTAASAVPLNEAPRMPMIETSSRPRVRANAVADVRRGLRTALVRASCPTLPNGAPRIRPSPPTNGRDSAGPPRTAAMIAAPAPNPTVTAGPTPTRVAPPTMSAIARTAKPAPTRVRRPSVVPSSAALARIASTGATRAARAAGTQALTIVTTMPTNSAASTAAG